MLRSEEAELFYRNFISEGATFFELNLTILFVPSFLLIQNQGDFHNTTYAQAPQGKKAGHVPCPEMEKFVVAK